MRLIIVMAISRGMDNKNGKVGHLVYYMLNGKQVVRTIGAVGKDRILREKSFDRMRENMCEFGAASLIGKVLRNGFAPFSGKCGDPYISGRLNAVVKKIISLGAGKRGERNFEINNYGYLLKGFEFNKLSSFGAVFTAPYSEPAITGNGSFITWGIPVFDTGTGVNAPAGATHCKLFLSAVIMSDYRYNEQDKAYRPVELNMNRKTLLTASSPIELNGLTGADVLLNIDMEDPLPALAGAVIAVGIVFYQYINGDLYELANGVAMRIEAVGV